MTIIQSIILGIIQGITEFLPISSSGHLVIVPYLLGWQIPEAQIFPFDVLVQIGTLAAVIIYYWKDLLEIGSAVITGIKEKKPFGTVPARTGWFTILATIPAGVIGLLFKDNIEAAFSNPQIAAALLLLTAAMLYASEKISKQSRDIRKLDWIDAIVMGLAQALAVFPGISRSGSTISGGLARNLKRKTAGQFAFLMSIPIMAAAGLLGIIDLFSVPNLTDFLPVMAVGFITSGVIGYFAIKWLITYISSNDLTPFALYCLFIGIGTLLLSVINPVSSPVLETSSEISTYTIAYQPAAEWMITDMHTCIEETNQAHFLLEKNSGASPEGENEFLISYGEPSLMPDVVYQIGMDTLVLAANQSHPLDQITLEALREIFSGAIGNISNLEEICTDCIVETGDPELAFHVWAYPPSSALAGEIEEMVAIHAAPGSTIAPTAALMKQALTSDTTSLGFLPAKMLESGIKEIIIIGEQIPTNTIPLLISSNEEPDDAMKAWIACLQNAIK